MPGDPSVTMDADDTLTFWTRWARTHDKTYPLLARALPHWGEFFARETSPWEYGENPYEETPERSDIDWEEDLSLSQPWIAQEAWEMAPEVQERAADVLNKAAFDAILAETTWGEEREADPDLSYETLMNRLRQTTDPLARFALLDGPVELTTQMTWFAAWWIQEMNPPAVPSPAWANPDSLLNWPDPTWWEDDQAPMPRWYHEWLHEWMEDNYGTDGQDWYQQTTF